MHRSGPRLLLRRNVALPSRLAFVPEPEQRAASSIRLPSLALASTHFAAHGVDDAASVVRVPASATMPGCNSMGRNVHPFRRTARAKDAFRCVDTPGKTSAPFRCSGMISTFLGELNVLGRPPSPVTVFFSRTAYCCLGRGGNVHLVDRVTGLLLAVCAPDAAGEEQQNKQVAGVSCDFVCRAGIAGPNCECILLRPWRSEPSYHRNATRACQRRQGESYVMVSVLLPV